MNVKHICAFCGAPIEADTEGLILVHHVMSSDRYKGCAKYADDKYPMIVCPFSNMSLIENTVHLMRDEQKPTPKLPKKVKRKKK